MFNLFNFVASNTRRSISLPAFNKTLRYMTLNKFWPKKINVNELTDEQQQHAAYICLQFCKREDVKSMAYMKGVEDERYRIYNQPRD